LGDELSRDGDGGREVIDVLAALADVEQRAELRIEALALVELLARLDPLAGLEQLAPLLERLVCDGCVRVGVCECGARQGDEHEEPRSDCHPDLPAAWWPAASAVA